MYALCQLQRNTTVKMSLLCATRQMVFRCQGGEPSETVCTGDGLVDGQEVVCLFESGIRKGIACRFEYVTSRMYTLFNISATTL